MNNVPAGNYLYTTRSYPCGCQAEGRGDIPAYCHEHGEAPSSEIDRLTARVAQLEEQQARSGRHAMRVENAQLRAALVPVIKHLRDEELDVWADGLEKLAGAGDETTGEQK